MPARMDYEPGIWSGDMPVAASGRLARGYNRPPVRLIGRPWFRVEQIEKLRLTKEPALHVPGLTGGPKLVQGKRRHQLPAKS